jgi:hypothetical protein
VTSKDDPSMTDVPNILKVGAFSSILFQDGHFRGKPVPSPLVGRVAIAPAIAEARLPEHSSPLPTKQLSQRSHNRRET